jgi:predicted enzyme related to lactoylglutathione lyase
MRARLGYAPRVSERSEYAPGTFCWCDLATTDQDGAKAFYGALLGWETDDIPVSDGVVYSMMRLRGKQVAAIAPQQQQQRDAGAPPAWNNYVSVIDADAIVERATELGGSAHAPAFDVMDAGRMAVLQDPLGAFFMVWQPGRHHGARLVTEVGALTWNELVTSDVPAASSFYSDLFGWTVTPFEANPTPYWLIMNGERSNGGIMPPPDPMPSFWLPYFGVEDTDVALAKLEELGGSKRAGPFELPMGKIAIVTDPQGAGFALYSGRFED